MGAHLVVMAMIADDVDGLDDIDVLETGANAKLGTDLFLVLTFSFAGATRTELLYSIYCASRLGTASDKTNSAACARAKNTTPFAVLLGDVSVSG